VTIKAKVKDPDAFKLKLAKKGFSLSGFALEAEISTSYFNMIANGVRSCAPATASKITATLKEEFDDLFIIDQGKEEPDA
jgi:hypothetical protein